MRQLLLMWDYACSGLWRPGEDGYHVDDVRELGISPGLADAIEAWAAVADHVLERSAGDAPEWSDAELARQDRNGLALARRLAAELPDREVAFHDSRSGERSVVPVPG